MHSIAVVFKTYDHGLEGFGWEILPVSVYLLTGG